MPIVREPDAVIHRLHGATFHSFVSPASGGRELCAWRLEVAAGQRGVPHRVSREEVFLLLDGELTVTLDGVAEVLRPGEVARVPAGSQVCVDNESGAAAAVWVTTVPGLEATMPDGTSFVPPWVR